MTSAFQKEKKTKSRAWNEFAFNSFAWPKQVGVKRGLNGITQAVHTLLHGHTLTHGGWMKFSESKLIRINMALEKRCRTKEEEWDGVKIKKKS